MAKNTGKLSETVFENHFRRLGKRAAVHRLLDASDVKGLTGRIGDIPPQPSDYVLTVDGKTSFAEVKSTQDPTAFRFSLLRRTQTAQAAIIGAAGGSYDLYIHHLPSNAWYILPYTVVIAVKHEGRASIPWEALRPYQAKDF